MKVIEIRNKEEYLKKIDDRKLSKSFNVYCRVSTKDQIDNTSLNNQRDIGIEYCKNKFGVIDEFKYIIVWREEGKSGSGLVLDDSDSGEYLSRELLTLMMLKWKEGIIKNLWVLDLSRLSRNDISSMFIRSKLHQHGIDLFVENTQYNFDDRNDKLMFGMISMVNDYENSIRFEKLTMGKLRILEEDKHWGGIIPFGYEKDDSGRLIIGEKSKLVKMIFNQYKNYKIYFK